MRMFTKAAIFAAAFAVPAVSFAQAPAAAPAAPAAQAAPAAPAAKEKKAPAAKETKEKKEKAGAVASHTTSGTVKTSSDTELVISKGKGKAAKDETFTVNASTKKTGDVAVGSKVTVAYTVEGKDMVATSIKAAAPKAPKKDKK